VRERLSEEDKVRLDAEMKTHNKELLGYTEGLLEATDLPIATQMKCLKSNGRKRKPMGKLTPRPDKSRINRARNAF